MHHRSTARVGSFVIAMSLTLLSAMAPPSLAAEVMSAQHESELGAIADARGISVAEASTRDQFRQRAQPLYDAVTADPYNFAGIYSTDDGGRWRIVVRYVGDATRPDITALVAADIPVDWVPAQNSMARLNEVFGELRNALASEIASKRISQITPDEASNTVLVGFPKEDPDLQKTLTDIYGDILSFKNVPVFEPVACTTRYECTPWRGGIAAQRV